MKKSFLVASALATVIASGPVMAQSVGNPAKPVMVVDGCSVCTFVINQPFLTPGQAVNAFSFYAGRAGDITPLLLSRTDTATDAVFTVLAAGQTRTASLGLNSFAFSTVSGTNVTGPNTYFGFAVPGSGVVAFDYAPSGTFAFVGPQSYVPTTAGNFFSSSLSAQDNAYGALNRRIYSINAAVPEPASWALLIAGFGVVGYAMRRRTVRVTAAA